MSLRPGARLVWHAGKSRDDRQPRLDPHHYCKRARVGEPTALRGKAWLKASSSPITASAPRPYWIKGKLDRELFVKTPGERNPETRLAESE